MKVKCMNLIDSDDGWLENGKEYIVLGLIINEGKTELYLEPSKGKLAGYLSIEEFEILSNYIPSNWIITFEPDFKFISIHPKKWEEEPKGFWEGYTDGDLEMTKLFEQERDLIYGEEP